MGLARRRGGESWAWPRMGLPVRARPVTPRCWAADSVGQSERAPRRDQMGVALRSHRPRRGWRPTVSGASGMAQTKPSGQPKPQLVWHRGRGTAAGWRSLFPCRDASTDNRAQAPTSGRSQPELRGIRCRVSCYRRFRCPLDGSKGRTRKSSLRRNELGSSRLRHSTARRTPAGASLISVSLSPAVPQ